MEELIKSINEYENKRNIKPMGIKVSQSFYHYLKMSLVEVGINNYIEPYKRRLCGLPIEIDTQMEEDFRLI